jgi:NTP pyrophosphatase (non-canonical NTP hydrolase)
MSNFKTLVNDIEHWAEERGILEHSKPQAQLLKAVSELGELCDAEIKGMEYEQADAVGDVFVCLVIYCAMKDYDIEACLSQAYAEIKNRKGKMVEGGAFVKDA